MKGDRKKTFIESFSPIERICLSTGFLILGTVVFIECAVDVIKYVGEFQADYWGVAILIMFTLASCWICAFIIRWTCRRIIPDVVESINQMEKEYEERAYHTDDPSLSFAAYLFDKRRD